MDGCPCNLCEVWRALLNRGTLAVLEDVVERLKAAEHAEPDADTAETTLALRKEAEWRVDTMRLMRET